MQYSHAQLVGDVDRLSSSRPMLLSIASREGFCDSRLSGASAEQRASPPALATLESSSTPVGESMVIKL
jgi:hypothetical protein